MVAVTKFINIPCRASNVHQIEQFVEDISNNLFINESYFGNILTSLTLLFNYIIENDDCQSIEIHYNTNYKTVKIKLSGFKRSLINDLLGRLEIIDTSSSEDAKNIFLIQNLTDGISYSADFNELSLVYDISALHDKVYNARKDFLEYYFHKEKNRETV